MPTYEYRCSKGHVFEVFQRISDAPLKTCTHCGAPAERIVSGGAGFLFKGEGFYITDYRSEDYKKKAEAERGGKPPKRTGTGEAGAASAESSKKSESGSSSGSGKGSSSSQSSSSSGASGSSGGSGSTSKGES